jgi:uncharacterized protein (TIGR02145 family)
MKKILPIIAVILSLVFTVSCNDPEDKIVDVTGVTLNRTTAGLSMLDNDRLTLTATVLPAKANNKDVFWSSSDNSVATVSNMGVVTAVAHGTATIIVTTEDGNKTDSCIVTVNFLGQVSFKTSQVWTIPAAHGAPEQEWSDVVLASGCKKSTYHGGSMCGVSCDTVWFFYADCRQNTGYGDLFSWQAVNDYKDELCPDGWRVPEMQDFINLDIALGGTGTQSVSNMAHANRYLNTWVATFGGHADPNGTLEQQGSRSLYWSQTSRGENNGRNLGINIDGNVNPRGGAASLAGKRFGMQVRCVRD